MSPALEAFLEDTRERNETDEAEDDGGVVGSGRRARMAVGSYEEEASETCSWCSLKPWLLTATLAIGRARLVSAKK